MDRGTPLLSALDSFPEQLNLRNNLACKYIICTLINGFKTFKYMYMYVHIHLNTHTHIYYSTVCMFVPPIHEHTTAMEI